MSLRLQKQKEDHLLLNASYVVLINENLIQYDVIRKIVTLCYTNSTCLPQYRSRLQCQHHVSTVKVITPD